MDIVIVFHIIRTVLFGVGSPGSPTGKLYITVQSWVMIVGVLYHKIITAMRNGLSSCNL